MNWRIIFLWVLSLLATSCRGVTSASTEGQIPTANSFLLEGSIVISTAVPVAPPNTARPASLPTTTPTITILQVNLPSQTATSTLAPTLTPGATREYILVDVYFVSRNRLANGQTPVEVAGVRWARSNNIMRTVLDEYFKGPGTTERSSYGWIAPFDGFNGYSRIESVNGVVRLYLTGECKLEDPKYTVADILMYNLKKLPDVEYVKIYDQEGLTQDPYGLSDSVPGCLEP
jgi:hypothetical protein